MRDAGVDAMVLRHIRSLKPKKQRPKNYGKKRKAKRRAGRKGRRKR